MKTGFSIRCAIVRLALEVACTPSSPRGICSRLTTIKKIHIFLNNSPAPLLIRIGVSRSGFGQDPVRILLISQQLLKIQFFLLQ
jgi:hypothetical protein